LCRCSASLILRRQGRLLYGIRPPKHEQGRQVLELTGIGGGMEDGDESLTAGVQREAREEIGSGVRLLHCHETLVVHSHGAVERIALQGDERPAALVFRHYRTPAHRPWHENHQGEGCLVVFLAQLDRAGSLPRMSCARLTDSQEALAQALEEDALRFFETLAQGEAEHG